jgi:hypothetical protein
MAEFMCVIKAMNPNILTTISILLSIVTIIAAIYIPRRIRIDQEFSSLSEQYRSPEMGFAVLSIFHFYKNDCNCNPDLIYEKYKKRYEQEIGDELSKPWHDRKLANPALTLQFQRRLVAYFYWDMSKLYVDSKWPWLTKKQIKQFITDSERNLISLVLQMSEVNSDCFAKYENVIEPPDDEVAMNQLLKQLYDTTEDL